MKTIVIYHSSDLDGQMSAAIVKKWFNETNKGDLIKSIAKNNEYYKFTDNGQTLIEFVGYNYGDEIPNLSKYDKVIMCDISFSNEQMEEIAMNCGEGNFIWIDHHISAINSINAHIIINAADNWIHHIAGIRDIKFAACELTWKYFFPNEEMPELVRLLGRYDCFGHKGTDEEQTVLEFQYAMRAYCKNMDDCYNYLTGEGFLKINLIEKYEFRIGLFLELGKGIYKYLHGEAKQSYKNGFPIYFEESVPYPNYTTLRKFVGINKEKFNPDNFGIDYRKDGYDGVASFYYADGKWNFTLYSNNKEVDCSVIAKTFGGGGHRGAAGFRVDNLEKIFKTT